MYYNFLTSLLQGRKGRRETDDLKGEGSFSLSLLIHMNNRKSVLFKLFLKGYSRFL